MMKKNRILKRKQHEENKTEKKNVNTFLSVFITCRMTSNYTWLAICKCDRFNPSKIPRSLAKFKMNKH